jgi:membrane protease YdiL (CAAX protease family)
LAYAAAFALMNSASVLLVLGVALERNSGSRARLPEEAESFSLSASGVMSVALVNATVLLLVAFFAAGRRGGHVWTTLRLGPTRASPIGFAAAIAGMMGLSFACGSASDLLGVRGSGVMEKVARALEMPTPAAFLFAVAAIGLAPGFAEETFFRGLIQPWLRSRWARWPSIVATSVGFGVMHGDPVQGSLTFVAGLFLGWTAERFGGVRPTIAAHAVNNAIFVALSSLGSSETPSRRVQTALLAIGAASFAASVAVLRGPRAIEA